MTLEEKIVAYWDNQPCNVKHGKSKIGTVEYFQEVSERRFKVEPHIPEFAEFHLWQGKRVLEIGCGIGSDAEAFSKHGAEYVGIDISEASLDIARQRFEVLGLEGQFYNRNGSQDLTDLGEFDLVYSWGVIHHYPDIAKTVNNISCVVKSGGEFRFMVYNKNSWKYAMIQKGLDQFEAQSGCPYADAFTQDDVKNFLQQQKWSIEELGQGHCFMYNVEEYKKGNYVLEPWFEAMPEDVRDAIKKYLGWHLLVKAKRL